MIINVTLTIKLYAEIQGWNFFRRIGNYFIQLLFNDCKNVGSVFINFLDFTTEPLGAQSYTENFDSPCETSVLSVALW